MNDYSTFSYNVASMFSSLRELGKQTRIALGNENSPTDGLDNFLSLRFAYLASPRLEYQRSRAYCGSRLFWVGDLTHGELGPTADTLPSQDLMEYSAKAWRREVEAISLASNRETALIEAIKVLPKVILLDSI